MTIQVIHYSVDSSDCDVSHEIEEYKSWKQLIKKLTKEYEVDVYGDSVEDLDGGDEIIIQSDVSFEKWVLIQEEE